MNLRIYNNPLVSLVQTAWSHAGGQRVRLVTYVLMSMTGMCVILLEPLIIGRLINLVQDKTVSPASLPEIFWYLSAFVGVNLIFWLIHGPARILERSVALRIRTAYQLRIFNTVVSLPIQWHSDNHSGAVIERSSKATTSLFEFCDGSFDIIQTVIRLIGSLVALCIFMPTAGLVMGCAAAVAVVIVIFFDRLLLAQYEEINQRFRDVAEAVHDYFTNVTTVISLRLERSVASEVDTRLGQVRPIFLRSATANEIKWFTMSMFVSNMMALALGSFCYQEIVSGRVILAGTFFTLFEYLRRMTDSFFGFADKYSRIVAQAANVRGVEQIFCAGEALACSTASALPEKWQRLDIEGLSFSYSNGRSSQRLLQNLSFTLRRGRSVAFVGESGSGKSTLLSLLRGLHKVAGAKVQCDGVALPFGLQHIHQSTTLIPQEPEIFASTIRYNVSMGLDVTDGEITNAIRLAQFEQVLSGLPRGLDTDIAEKGVNLSGGQKQRLALARGIFFARHSSIVLLDEPTSSVDVFNERAIYKSILSLFKDRCVISAVHKFHLLPLFDEIFVFANGQLVERGSFEELIASRGELNRLWSSHELDEDKSDESAVLRGTG